MKLKFHIFCALSLGLSAFSADGAIPLTDNYELKEMVILSRHNIRAPLSGNDSVLGKATSHQWIDWSANASELTLKGGVLETMMGQYFRKLTQAAGLFKEGTCPTTDEINIYANSMQRTVATARYFQAGFAPTCETDIYHRFSPSKMDPVFFPRLTKVTDEFKVQAMKEINAMGGEKGLYGVSESLTPSYRLIEKVMDLSGSELCKADKTCELNDYNTEVVFKLGDEPNLTGTLKLANRIADALILQYYEESDPVKAAFGKNLTVEQWTQISKIKDVYGDVLFTAPIVAVNVANPLIRYMKDELSSDVRKFTFLVGHDSNIASVLSALQAEDYALPETIEKKTPIGSKLVFEKWQNKQTGERFISAKIIYQNTQQLRGLSALDLNNPPAAYGVKFTGLEMNKDGLYKQQDIMNRFERAINAYEAIH